MSDGSATAADAAPATVPKRDPETLILRGRPRAAVRFKRELIIALAAAAASLLMLVTWFALRAHIHYDVAAQDDQSEPSSAAPSETLSRLPKSYADVPQLGPPLPGDLGKPILEHEHSLEVDPRDPNIAQATQAMAADRQRQLAELKAARQSSVLVQSSGRNAVQGAAEGASAESRTAEAPDMAKLAIDPEHDPNAQQRKSDFAATLSKDSDVNPHRLAPAASPYLLSAGSVIAASLITGLNSDLPGMVIAQVSEPVYDSPTGRTLLIPQGARLIGKYDSVVAYGQKRALIVWQRIIMPDGASLTLDNLPASDLSGYAGLADKVDRHSWQLLKTVAISTIFGVGSELQFTGQGGLVQAIRQSGQQNSSHAADQLTSKTLDIQPTITVRPGVPVRLLVERDLVLDPRDFAIPR